MLRPRIIPCLLLSNGGLVKTVKFGSPKYVGDPLNAVRIFNEKEVDELIFLDIDASKQQRDPDYALIKSIAAECRMPLCYGGGVRSVEQFDRIITLGVEKVAVSSAAIDSPQLVREAARRVGSQSVVVVLDVKKNTKTNEYEVWTLNGTKRAIKTAAACAKEFEELGAGEIVVNSIDTDGAMSGYDLALARLIRETCSLPMTVLGGAGSMRDIGMLIKEFGPIGAGAGSLFVFKGIYRAVLINYPNRTEKDALLMEYRRT